METSKEWLDFLNNLPDNSTYTSTTVKRVTTQNKPLLKVSVDAVYELYANLVLAGFEIDEALVIVVGVITHGDCE